MDIEIAGRKIGLNHKPFVIAEMSVKMLMKEMC